LRSFAERAAINAPIQGSASDIAKIAMINLDKEISRLGLAARMVLQIHDSILLIAPDSEVDRVIEITRNCMQKAAYLSIPLLVDVKVAQDWSKI
jgi:DNA polymerase-1